MYRTAARNRQFRLQLGQRHQHKGTFVHSRVRQRQFAAVRQLTIYQQQVNIDGTRPPAAIRIALSAQLPLHFVAGAQQVQRGLQSESDCFQLDGPLLIALGFALAKFELDEEEAGQG